MAATKVESLTPGAEADVARWQALDATSASPATNADRRSPPGAVS